MPFVAAAVGAFLLAFSTVFWSYSVVAEVFALNNLFAALLLLLGFEWSQRPDRPRLLWSFALLLGLSLTNQQTILLLVPAFLVLGWSGLSTLRRTGTLSRGLRPRNIAAALGLFVLGLLPYLYLPIAARGDPAVNWGDPSTFHRFADHVTRANYGTFRLTVEGRQGSISEQLGLLSSNLLRGFVVVGVVLAVVGLLWTWRHRRSSGLALATAFLFAGPIFVAYSKVYVPDDLTKGVIARFYMLPSIPLAVLAGVGAWQALLWTRRIRGPAGRPQLIPVLGAVALVAVLLGSAVANAGTADHRGDRVALHYGQDLLRPLAPNALLLMRSDENYTSVDYAQFVDGYRKDVVAIDTELLRLSTYDDQVRREHPGIILPFDAYDPAQTGSLAKLVRSNLQSRPVYYVGQMADKTFPSGFDQLRVGFARRLYPKGTVPDTYALLRAHPSVFAAYRYPNGSYPASSWEKVLATSYGGVASDLGYALQSSGRKADQPVAERMLRTAIRLAPDLPANYKDLGVLLADSGGDPREIVSLFRRFLQLRPNDPQAGAIRTEIAKFGGTPP